MRIGVPKETAAGEHRVGLVPEVVRAFSGDGHEVVVQAGAGEGAMIPDEAYVEAGASLAGGAGGPARGRTGGQGGAAEPRGDCPARRRQRADRVSGAVDQR